VRGDSAESRLDTVTTAKQLSPEIEARIQQLWPRFPPEAAGKALCLPVLYLAQEQFGHVDEGVVDAVAARLELPPAHVAGVATFYTMINKERRGRFHLQICTNIACMLDDAYGVLEHCQHRLGIRENHGTTADGSVTVSEVECLAACGYGPVMQMHENGREVPVYFENLDRAKIDQILDALAEGRVPTELGR
jgi:NADH-quinone oxidoreductase subunit E